MHVVVSNEVEFLRQIERWIEGGSHVRVLDACSATEHCRRRLQILASGDGAELLPSVSSVQLGSPGVWSTRTNCAYAAAPHLDSGRSCKARLSELAEHLKPESPLLYVGQPARFAAVVALHKSGTHLIARFMEEVGLTPFGNGVQVGPPPNGCFDWPTWEEREFNSRPDGMAYFSHTLPLVPLKKPGERDRPLLRQWLEHKFPLIYNYRDPRAVISSLTRYCLNQIVGEPSYHSAWIKVLGEVLQSLETTSDQLLATIELMDEYLDRQYRDHLWLLRHPQVACSSFESLVGAQGGGERSTQAKVVARLLVHLSMPGCPIAIGEKIYCSGVRTFSRGKAQGWQEDFHDVHNAAFLERYHRILLDYAYPVSPFPTQASQSSPPAARVDKSV